ncbi:MAG: hypothetical protein R6X07_07480 [Desulfatiglandales bacterium]
MFNSSIFQTPVNGLFFHTRRLAVPGIMERARQIVKTFGEDIVSPSEQPIPFKKKNRNFQFDRSATCHYDPPDICKPSSGVPLHERIFRLYVTRHDCFYPGPVGWAKSFGRFDPYTFPFPQWPFLIRPEPGEKRKVLGEEVPAGKGMKGFWQGIGHKNRKARSAKPSKGG